MKSFRNKVIAITVALICLFPLFWMFLGGMKEANEVLAVPFKFFPKSLNFSNYTSLLNGSLDETVFPKGASFIRSIGTTFIVAAISTVLSIFINSAAGYIFARKDFPLKKILWSIMLIPWFVPGITTYITSYILVSKLNLLNTIWVLIFPGVAHSYSIFYYRQYYLGLPRSLEESAEIDGATPFQIYTKIILPISKTPFTIMGTMVFLGYWSSFLWPSLTISDPKLFQINQLISYFKSAYNQNTHLVLAASSLAAIPVIILFILFQKHIMQGIKMNGIK